ncbi:MAG: ABC transporter ATP-binding protein [Armatimonadota bacterium]|nr:ABC transporter ATP-binding protein [Armatimonadota bacterium]
MAGRVKIRVEGATRTFLGGAVLALDRVTLDVYENEIACLVGPSGCGKTTLLRALDGLLPLSAGQITIDGAPVTGPPPNVAMVFQHFGLFPWKTVKANAAYGLKLAGAPRDVIEARVQRVLRLVGLEGFEHVYPYQLSGGMQQRVGLARALAMAPEILLMDEPFAALDAQTRELLQEETLRILEEERKTIVFVTHSIDEAILLGDRVIVLTARPGRVKQIVPVPFARPRRLAAIRADPAFGELRTRLWELLRQEMQ